MVPRDHRHEDGTHTNDRGAMDNQSGPVGWEGLRQYLAAETFPGADKGSCRKLPLSAFFPAGEGEHQNAHEECYRWARVVCEGCVVREACRDYAMSRPEPYGVWGGTTPADRQKKRRRGR